MSSAKVFEFGIGNAECGKKKRRKRAEVFEFGIGNAECGKKKRRKRAEGRGPRLKVKLQQ
jgi:hypothetical protein